jgi:flagellar protein FliL
MTTVAKEEELKEATAAKGGKKKIIIMVVPLILILAGAGWFFFLKPSSSGAAAKALPAPKPGVVVPIVPITINLADSHFLKIGVSLQPTAAAKSVDGAEATDLMISEFSGRDVNALNTDTGRDALKEALIARIKLAYLPDGKVTEAQTAAANKKVSGGKAITDDQLTDEQAIKRADALTVQSNVYDVYFTEFVFQ